MKQFEYTYVKLGLGPAPFSEILKGSGRDGWELCGFEYGCAWFKREILGGEEVRT